MSIIYFPFSSNIRGLQDIKMRQPTLSNADFARRRNFGDVDLLRRRTDKVLAFQMLSWTKQVRRRRTRWARQCLKSAWLISNIYPSLVISASLKWKKIKHSDSNCQVNDALMLSWIATRFVSRCGEIWGRLARQEGADWPPGQWLRFFPISSKIQKKRIPCKKIFQGSCPTKRGKEKPCNLVLNCCLHYAS